MNANVFEYYSFDENCERDINSCSLCSDKRPLIVNCTGKISTSFPFTTDNPGGRQDYYLLFVTSGKMTVYLPAGDVIAHDGSLFLFPPKFHYRYTYSGGEVLNYLWVHFTGSYAASFLEELGIFPFPFYVDQLPAKDSLSILFSKLFDASIYTGKYQKNDLSIALESLLVKIAKSLKPDSKKGRLFHSLQYINTNFHTELSLADLARKEHLSVSRYCVLFREQFGVSPIRYIINLRLKYACDLLKTTNMPIKQIGLLSGFEDPHFFSKIFKKHMGISPMGYRNEQCAIIPQATSDSDHSENI